MLSFFSVHTCENMPSVCNERGFTNIHKLFNIETCTISGRPLMQGFLMEVYHAKKRKEKKLSFTRLLNNKFLCFRQVVTKHKSKYVSMSTSETTSCIFWAFSIHILVSSILEKYWWLNSTVWNWIELNNVTYTFSVLIQFNYLCKLLQSSFCKTII